MFENLIAYPIESPQLKWESKMVVRDEDRQARLFVRVRLTGTSFPIFNSIPFVRIGKVKARFVKIADDQLTVDAYFDSVVPTDASIEFGYDDQPLLRFPNAFHAGRVNRLDNTRLPANLRYQDQLLGAR